MTFAYLSSQAAQLLPTREIDDTHPATTFTPEVEDALRSLGYAE